MITMSALEEFAHTVQPSPGDAFDYWWETETGHAYSDPGRKLAREAFDLGRSVQLAADAHALAAKLENDHDLTYRREESRRRVDLRDVAAVHRESSRVPEKFQEG